jgi:hypothetical protein
MGRHALDSHSIHAIFLNKTLSRRPGVKDNDWIIFLEYDALSHYIFFAFFTEPGIANKFTRGFS